MTAANEPTMKLGRGLLVAALLLIGLCLCVAVRHWDLATAEESAATGAAYRTLQANVHHDLMGTVYNGFVAAFQEDTSLGLHWQYSGVAAVLALAMIGLLLVRWRMGPWLLRGRSVPGTIVVLALVAVTVVVNGVVSLEGVRREAASDVQLSQRYGQWRHQCEAINTRCLSLAASAVPLWKSACAPLQGLPAVPEPGTPHPKDDTSPVDVNRMSFEVSWSIRRLCNGFDDQPSAVTFNRFGLVLDTTADLLEMSLEASADEPLRKRLKLRRRDDFEGAIGSPKDMARFHTLLNAVVADRPNLVRLFDAAVQGDMASEVPSFPYPWPTLMSLPLDECPAAAEAVAKGDYWHIRHIYRHEGYSWQRTRLDTAAILCTCGVVLGIFTLVLVLRRPQQLQI